MQQTIGIDDILSGLTDDDKASLSASVKQTFHTAATPYIRGLMEKSTAIRKQFAPHFAEGVEFGRLEAFEEGKMNAGIYGLERIYEDRAVLTPYFGCASYCRYCFKKARTLAGPNTRMTPENIEAAIAHIEGDERITTALITGGDPLAKPEVTLAMVERLTKIPHISKIRIGTRHVLFRPESLTDDIAEAFASFNHIDTRNPLRSRNISLGVSLNHPDELQPEVIAAITRFTRRGVAVRGQIALLKTINDSTKILRELLDIFLAIGVTPYYLFHCMDVVGTYHMRTSVQKGIDMLSELSEFSGTYAIPYVYVTPVGKHRVSPGTTLQYEIIDGKRYIRTRSPYRASRFLEFSGKTKLPALHEIDSDGYIISRYLDGNDDIIDY